MAKKVFWILFFSLCMLIGYLHGSNPDFSAKAIVAPKKIIVFSTHENLLPSSVRQSLEKKLNITFVYKLETDWNNLTADLISSEGADLIIAPTHWLNSLNRQGLIHNISEHRSELLKTVSADFINQTYSSKGAFIPYFWIKTGFEPDSSKSPLQILEDKKAEQITLFNDVDLLAERIQQWKDSNILPLIKGKRILLADPVAKSAAHPEPLREAKVLTDPLYEDPHFKAALLMYGFAISKNTRNLELLYALLTEFNSTQLQTEILNTVNLNSCLESLEPLPNIEIPRKASFFRQLRLSNTIILNYKNTEAETIFREISEGN